MLNKKNDEKSFSSPKAFLIRDKLSPRNQITNPKTSLKDNTQFIQFKAAQNISAKKTEDLSLNRANPSSFIGNSPH
jgi:hypothetical protein